MLNLNVYAKEKEQIQQVSEHYTEMLRAVLPHTFYMPLTLETIKDVRLLPKADDKNQILQGAFQMPNNTHVVIDETEMSAGKLEGDVAMENLKGITVLIEECFVPCII